METWTELKLAGERADRMDREADGLHAEISRLTRTNEESTVNDQKSRNVERSKGELVALKEQWVLLVEDRCAALMREITELKELAREGTEGATAHDEEAQLRANKDGHPNLR